jgi:hypothetical protein
LVGNVDIGAPVIVVDTGGVSDIGVALVEVLRDVANTIDAQAIDAFLDFSVRMFVLQVVMILSLHGAEARCLDDGREILASVGARLGGTGTAVFTNQLEGLAGGGVIAEDLVV